MTGLIDRLREARYPEGLVQTAVRKAMDTNKNELRKLKVRNEADNILAFVHNFDPTLPQIALEVKNIISRIFSSRELRPIFGGTRVVGSQREPLSLGRLLQHSRFDENPTTENKPGVTRCGQQNCKSCLNILEVDEIYFRNSNIKFQIRAKMDCTVKNVIYVLICKSCESNYIGETVNLRDRMNSHRSKSTSETDAIAEVSRHLYNCGQGFWMAPIFKMREENKIARLVKEDHLIKLLKPNLNADTRNLLHLI